MERQLTKAIVESPLSLNQLAARCGVDVSVLSRFARGERTMTLPTAARVAKVLGLELKPAKRRPKKG
ncbi:MAG TPA: helix-turn-helix transcriptional regulator [Phycisphaerae bacterium]|nr:helix-turn-helix transcriptional regulator [Phycisphaerae bacterium]